MPSPSAYQLRAWQVVDDEMGIRISYFIAQLKTIDCFNAIGMPSHISL
ncbi:MAG TPA: hypothetical protein PK185_12665 [Cyclobacteriaceae bacterium]|nr:hypothetical protein [Cyclobacteriaceae bacterium]